MISNCTQCNSDNLERFDHDTLECLDCGHKMDSEEDLTEWDLYLKNCI